MTSSRVYHFSDSLHLPWIVASGELRPHLNHLVGIGDVNYLWATTNPDGDKTAQALIKHRFDDRETYQFGEVFLVRFTLPSPGFVPWRDVKRKSNWTPEQVEELESLDRKFFDEYGQAKWRLRRKPVPLSSVLKVEANDGRDLGCWWPIKLTRRNFQHVSDDPATMVSIINGFHYYSTAAGRNERGLTDYVVPDREEVAAMWEEAEA